MEILSWSLTLALMFFIYYVLTLSNNYFHQHSVPHHKAIPILGNLAPFLFQRKHISEVLQDLCNIFPKRRFFGFFDFWMPVYMVKDVNLVKQICIKDFDHFVNHRIQLSEKYDPLFANNLFAMNDTRWRNMRAVLSPAFTGSKMRSMLGLMADYCGRAMNITAQKLRDEVIDLEMKDMFTKMSNDIVASCAFGIEVNSLDDPINPFYTTSLALTNLNGIQGLKLLGYMSIPKVMKFFKITIIDKKMTTFYRDLIRSTIALRENTRISRPDMIHLLMQARSQQLKFAEINSNAVSDATQDQRTTNDDEVMNWTDDDFAAQCVIFLFAGFETVATLNSFIAYEIAVNPTVQTKLRDEIDQIHGKLNGRQLTYEVLQEMSYMDMVITETLRKWPPVAFLDRRCTKPYVLQDNDGSSVQLKPGDSVWIPAYAIMRNAEYFPQPDKFDPERFSPENRPTIDPNAFLSFGLGPRNCIGSRFALMEAKATFFYLLSKFTLEKGPKTQHPLEIKASSIAMQAKHGFWVRLRKRSSI